VGSGAHNVQLMRMALYIALCSVSFLMRAAMFLCAAFTQGSPQSLLLSWYPWCFYYVPDAVPDLAIVALFTLPVPTHYLTARKKMRSQHADDGYGTAEESPRPDSAVEVYVDPDQEARV
jgi:hypothetical protein